jgi:hypothetical protein
MATKKLQDLLVPIFTFLLIIGISAAVIAYGKGYRLDITHKSVNPTGLIAATSDPTGAQVLIDGKLKTATNNTMNISPGWYTVTIEKEGFQPWEKKLRVQGEIVTRADAYLFPTNPSLSTITTNGVLRPTLSPDGSKLAYVIPETQTATQSSALIDRSGIWVLDMVEKPIGFNRDARRIAKSTTVDFTKATLLWSPDSKQILATVPHPITTIETYYLLDADRSNDMPQSVYDMQTLIKEWQDLASVKIEEKLSVLKPEALAILRPLMSIISFSPDETKILYEATAAATIPQIIKPSLIGTNTTEENRTIKSESIYVYDSKEDRNYLIGDKNSLGFPKPTPTPKPVRIKQTAPIEPSSYLSSLFSLPSSTIPIMWLPTNRHLILVSKDKIEAMDYDATNRKTLYAGPFADRFVVPWSNASRIFILTTLNPAAGTLPNLYAVNLR